MNVKFVRGLCPNTRVVKCNYYVSQKQNGFNNKIRWYSILLTYIVKYIARFDGIHGNTKNQELTPSSTDRVRLLHPLADLGRLTFVKIISRLNDDDLRPRYRKEPTSKQ